MDRDELIQLHITQSSKTARIEALVEDMHTRLFENETGFVAKANERLHSLEQSRSSAKGAFAVVGAMLSFLGWPYIKTFFGK